MNISYMAIPGVAIVSQETNMKILTRSVCSYFGLSFSEITGARRYRKLVYPRHLAIYLVRTKTNLPLKTIGEYFCSRDHTTIIHSVQTIKNLMFYDEAVKNDIRGINLIAHS